MILLFWLVGYFIFFRTSINYLITICVCVCVCVCAYILFIIYFKDHQNKNKRNPQLQLIEKKIENFLQHWRGRIGLESSKKQVITSI